MVVVEIEGILQLKSSRGDGAGSGHIIAKMPNAGIPVSLLCLQSIVVSVTPSRIKARITVCCSTSYAFEAIASGTAVAAPADAGQQSIHQRLVGEQ